MTAKERFKKDTGYSYEAFRTWLKNHHDYTITEAKQLGKYQEFVGLYGESKLNSNFEKRNGFPHRSFATYVKCKYDYGLSDLPESMYQTLIDEYREYRLKKSFTRDALFDLITRYATGVTNGTEIEVTESENELIAMLEA